MYYLYRRRKLMFAAYISLRTGPTSTLSFRTPFTSPHPTSGVMKSTLHVCMEAVSPEAVATAERVGAPNGTALRGRQDI